LHGGHGSLTRPAYRRGMRMIAMLAGLLTLVVLLLPIHP
jgi:hypothetical protein